MNSINLLFIPFSHLPYLILSLRTSCAKPPHIMCYPSAHYVLALRTSCVKHHHPFYQCLLLFNFIPLFLPFFHLVYSSFASLPLRKRTKVEFLHHLTLSKFASLPLRGGSGWGSSFTPTTYDRSLYSLA